jgi:hypothetical protein
MRLAGGPPAWDVATVRSENTWVHQLGDAEVDELVIAARRAASFNADLESFDERAFQLSRVSDRLAGILDELLDGRGFALVRGIPVAELSRDEVRVLYWGLGRHLGIPIRQSDAGELIVSVIDEGKDFTDPTVRGYQTNDHLEFHSDSSDLVGLLCIRPALSGGASMIVSGASIHDEIARRSPRLLEVLHQPFWFDRRKADQTSSFFACPVFSWTGDGRLTVYYGRAHIESAQRGREIPQLTPEQLEALDLFDQVASDPHFALTMDFRPGDIQFLNNHIILHCRTAYEDAPNSAHKRELLRLWLTVRRPLRLSPQFAEAGIVARGEAFRSS